MYCRECGTKNEDGSKFCMNCGIVLAETQENDVMERPIREKQKNGRFKLTGRKLAVVGVVIGILLVAVLLISTVAIRTDKSTPEDVVIQLYKCLNDRNGKGVIELAHEDAIEKRLNDLDMDVNEYIHALENNYMHKNSAYILSVDKCDEKDTEYKQIRANYDVYYDLRVKDVVEVKVMVSYIERSYVATWYVAKIGSKWYLTQTIGR